MTCSCRLCGRPHELHRRTTMNSRAMSASEISVREGSKLMAVLAPGAAHAPVPNRKDQDLRAHMAVVHDVVVYHQAPIRARRPRYVRRGAHFGEVVEMLDCFQDPRT